MPKLREDILSLVEPQSQTDPDFKAPFRSHSNNGGSCSQSIDQRKRLD